MASCESNSEPSELSEPNAAYEPEPRVRKKGVPMVFWAVAGIATIVFPPLGLIGIAIGILASQF